MADSGLMVTGITTGGRGVYKPLSADLTGAQRVSTGNGVYRAASTPLRLRLRQLFGSARTRTFQRTRSRGDELVRCCETMTTEVVGAVAKR